MGGLPRRRTCLATPDITPDEVQAVADKGNDVRARSLYLEVQAEAMRTRPHAQDVTGLPESWKMG